MVVKTYPANPGMSQKAFSIMLHVLLELGLPVGLIDLVQGANEAVGVKLIHHTLIAPSAFIGPTLGCTALQAEAKGRPRPILFYGELGSINPLIVLASALAGKSAELA